MKRSQLTIGRFFEVTTRRTPLMFQCTENLMVVHQKLLRMSANQRSTSKIGFSCEHKSSRFEKICSKHAPFAQPAPSVPQDSTCPQYPQKCLLSEGTP
jgi:hypothetical protein